MILEIGLEEKKSISVDQIREIHEFISLKTISSARFVIIDPADKLTVQASNALLKMLEEAPEKTYFFMISETLAFMLPTIRSRSSIYRFQPLSNENLKKIEGVSPESVSWARGRADMALALSNDNGHEGLKEAQEMLVAIIKSHPIDWKKVFPSFFQNDNGRKFFVPLWEEMLKKKLRGESFDFESEFPQEDSALLAIFESVQNLRNELARSFDKPLCLENFYYLTQHIKKSPEVALWN